MSHNQQVKRLCKQCGAEIWLSPSRVNNGRGFYCSKKCLFSSDTMKTVGRNMGLAQLGKKKPPFTEEHRAKIRAYQMERHANVLCNFKYRNEWGEIVKCKDIRKRKRKTCGKHLRYSVQRYFCSKINPNYCIDILL